MDLIFLQSMGVSGVLNMLLPLLIMVVFYFFLLRPQMNKQKAQDAFNNEITKGMEVVTSGGIIGKVNKVDGNSIRLEVDSNTYINITKGSISKEMTEAFQKLSGK
jgi:preprotein translocase subunit YajC